MFGINNLRPLPTAAQPETALAGANPSPMRPGVRRTSEDSQTPQGPSRLSPGLDRPPPDYPGDNQPALNHNNADERDECLPVYSPPDETTTQAAQQEMIKRFAVKFNLNQEDTDYLLYLLTLDLKLIVIHMLGLMLLCLDRLVEEHVMAG